MKWLYGPWNQGPEGELSGSGITQLTFTASRTDVPNVQVAIDGRHRAFGKIIPLVTDVWLLDDDGNVAFRGRATARSGGGTKLKASRSQTFVGYKTLALTQGLNTRSEDFGNVFTGVMPSDAAWALVATAAEEPNSNLAGIVRGPRYTSATPSFYNVDSFANLSDALDSVAKLVSADWDISPAGLDTLRFDFWPPGTRGTDRSIVIDVGGRAVAFTDQAAVDNYGNDYWGHGQNDDTGTGPGWTQQSAADIATRPEGRWTRIISTDQTNNAGLVAEVQGDLAAGQIVPITWTADLAPGWWKGPTHLAPGDPFRWICKAPGYDVDELQVVDSLTADFSANPRKPKVSVTFGAPAPSDRRWRRRVDQRLASLARRA